jgi:hypothetical protein
MLDINESLQNLSIYGAEGFPPLEQLLPLASKLISTTCLMILLSPLGANPY